MSEWYSKLARIAREIKPPDAKYPLFQVHRQTPANHCVFHLHRQGAGLGLLQEISRDASVSIGGTMGGFGVLCVLGLQTTAAGSAAPTLVSGGRLGWPNLHLSPPQLENVPGPVPSPLWLSASVSASFSCCWRRARPAGGAGDRGRSRPIRVIP